MDQAARELLLQRRAADELLIEAIFGDASLQQSNEGQSSSLGISVDSAAVVGQQATPAA